MGNCWYINGTGTVLTVGLFISKVAGFATFGAGTLVGLGITAGVSGVLGIGTGATAATVTHFVACDYEKDEKMYKDLALLFKGVGESRLKLHSFLLETWTALQNTQLFVRGIQLSDCKSHEISRCQDELLRLHEVTIEMYKITSSIKNK